MTKALSNQVRDELTRQHASLEEALQGLVRAASEVDPRALQASWAQFETDLLRHLDLEEKSLFPLVEGAHPDELRALRIEHDRIRDVVGELGVCCDLHAVRKQAVERLVRMLRSHAEREDGTLYRWVDQEAPLDTRRHLLRLLVNTVRSELQADASHQRVQALR
jgi:hemerythrin-like domain-containing protein